MKSLIIGIMLSDGYFEKRKGWNPRMRLEVSFKNFRYLWFIWQDLQILNSHYPNLQVRYLRDKKHITINFKTRQLKCQNELYLLFYKKDQRSLSFNIYEYFDDVVLAHWIMGDGTKRGKGLMICTENYTIKENIQLMNILNIKYGIQTKQIKQKRRESPKKGTSIKLGVKDIYIYRIYINSENIKIQKPRIKQQIREPFNYKI